MFCNMCGASIPDDSVFCNFCGNSIPPGVEQAGTEAAPDVAPAAPAGEKAAPARAQPVAASPAPAPSPAPPPPPPLPPPLPGMQDGTLTGAGPFNRETRRKAVIVGLISILVVGGLCAALILALRSGNGETQNSGGGKDGGQGNGKALSVSEYVDTVVPILRDSCDELLEVDLSSVDAGDMTDANVQQLKAIAPKLEARSNNLAGDLDALSDINPPQAAAALHQDILEYYDSALSTIDEMVAVVEYLAAMGESSLKMERAMESVQAQFDSVSTYDQLVPLVDQSYNAWSTFLAELQALKPPASLASFHQLQTQAAADLVDVYTRLRTAAVDQDAEAADIIAQEADAIGKDYEANLQSSLAEFKTMEQEYGSLQQELQGLIDQVEELL